MDHTVRSTSAIMPGNSQAASWIELPSAGRRLHLGGPLSSYV
jgi:hypothetical protein